MKIGIRERGWCWWCLWVCEVKCGVGGGGADGGGGGEGVSGRWCGLKLSKVSGNMTK